MKIRPVPSSWTKLNDLRLDSAPYLSGAFEAKLRINNLPVAKEPLVQLTKGHKGGIYNGPQFVRRYVDDAKYGVPFVTSGSILLADLSNIGLLSKKDAESKRLAFLQLKEGMTLISCSGTIGYMTYTRSDMSGFWSSQDVMKVVPDLNKILPGYLYSYISSKYGIPQIISGTYGAIIQHIEPAHIVNLIVPRLGEIEVAAHWLCEEGAELRVLAGKKFSAASKLINSHFNFPEKIALSHRVFSTTKTIVTKHGRRLEATFHDKLAQESDRLLVRAKALEPLSFLVPSIGETQRLKQVFVSSPEYGVPFLTSGEIFQLNLEPTRYLSKKLLPVDNSWAIKEGDILIARSGQVGGIIGHGVWADKRLESMCVSVDVLRLRADPLQVRSGYLFAYLCLTDVGYRQLVRTAAGSSIPHLLNDYIYDLLIPRADDETEKTIDELVWEAGRYRAEAQARETEARTIVERAIEGKN